MDPVLFDNSFQDIVDLNASEGPNTNVFEPKYLARQQMLQLKETIANAYARERAPLAVLQICRCLVFLGCNMAEVEEEVEGLVEIQKAYRLLDGLSSDELPEDFQSIEPVPIEDILNTEKHLVVKEKDYVGCVEYMRILNALGLLFSHRNCTQRLNDAIAILRRAEGAYQEWDSWFAEQQGTCSISELSIGENGRLLQENIPEGKQPLYALRFHMLSAYTSTLFYLAQVYAPLREVNMASKYCHLTMYYQLLCKQELVKKVWAANAIQLSGFYSSHFNYGRALHCLQAGEAMMPKDAPDESTTGLVAWAYGRFYLHRLEHYGDIKLGRVAAGPQKEDFSSYWLDFPIDGLQGWTELPDITSFEEARDTFKEANKWLQEAIAFHPFESSCTQHIEIKQDMSRLYGALISFETNRGRMAAMVQRRIDLTEAFPDQLNFNAYPIVIRQLLYDLGFLYEDIIRLRQDQRRNPSHSEKMISDEALNALVNTAKGYYDKFCETWRSPTTNQLPDVLDEDSRVPFFRALMRLAHVHMSFVAASPKEEYDNIARAIEAFQRAVDFSKKNTFPSDLSEGLAKEVALAEEMVKLLPRKQHDLWTAFQRQTR